MPGEKINQLYSAVYKMPEPENLYEGLSLSDDFELPDNILLFYHDFCAAAPNAHYRYTIVFPFAKMRYYVDQLQYDLFPGQFLLLHPYQLRFLSPKSQGYQRFFITFTLKHKQNYVPLHSIFDLNDETYNFLDKIICAYQNNELPELQIQVFNFLKNLSRDQFAEESKKMSKEIANAIRFINENLSSPICIQDVANELHMSESNLRRRFSAEVGQPLKNYVAKQRLELANYYLRETLMRIEEIAINCGFSSVFAFSHFFRNTTGISPLKYRSSCKNKAHVPNKSALE